MSSASRIFILFAFLVAYGVSYTVLDRNMAESTRELSPPPPLKLLQAVSGYFKQITAQMLFVRTSVFLGGVQAGTDAQDYEINLAHNLKTMTSLYPEFIDPYFFVNSFLAPISRYSAREAAAILKTGVDTLPNNFILRFFHAFNYFYHLNQPLLASYAFNEAAALKNAPPMFARLASIFSAHGGNLTAGMIMLKTMAEAEQNKAVKQRYLEEIKYFEQAIIVQNAIAAYTKKHQKPPEYLEYLVPEYLTALPVMQKKFIMVYEQPSLFLKRPDR